MIDIWKTLSLDQHRRPQTQMSASLQAPKRDEYVSAEGRRRESRPMKYVMFDARHARTGPAWPDTELLRDGHRQGRTLCRSTEHGHNLGSIESLVTVFVR